MRVDAGYSGAALAQAARDVGVDYAIAPSGMAPPGGLMPRSGETAWRDARDMAGAQVAACDYTLAGWPAGTYTIVRRVRVDAEEISTDPRSRRRRTIAKDQLRLALDGVVDHAFAVSFIVTDIPTNTTDLVGLEAWFRSRVSIEERFREAKLGAGLFHLPSADHTVNTVWTWAALLAGALNVMLAGLVGPQSYVRHPSRVHIATVRANLLATPARLIRHARGLTLRLPPGRTAVEQTLTRLRALPAAAY